MNLIALIKERARNYKCLACSQPLADCGVAVLTQNEGQCTVEVTCARCGVSFVAVLLLKPRKHPDGLPKAEEPISGDDLVDVHQALKEFHGRLADLLETRSPRP